MEDLQKMLTDAFELVDRRENAAALKLVDAILAELAPPDRVGAIPPARATIYDWLQLARKSLAGEATPVTPKIALRSALALVH